MHYCLVQKKNINRIFFGICSGYELTEFSIFGMFFFRWWWKLIISKRKRKTKWWWFDLVWCSTSVKQNDDDDDNQMVNVTRHLMNENRIYMELTKNLSIHWEKIFSSSGLTNTHTHTPVTQAEMTIWDFFFFCTTLWFWMFFKIHTDQIHQIKKKKSSLQHNTCLPLPEN